MPKPAEDPLKRFFDQCIPEPNSGCWIWTGNIAVKSGYSRLMLKGRRLVYGHRFSYETFVGPIPKDLVVDHICRTRCCVNPEHLRVVTNKDNILCGIGFAGLNAQKRTCPKGHEYSGDNIGYCIHRDGSVSRRCRTCRSEASKRQWATKRKGSQ